MASILTLVSYPFLPARVGGQKGIALFYKYFSKYHRVCCLTTRANDPALADGYEVLNSISPSPLRYMNPFLYFRMRTLVRERKITHLILEHPYYGWLGVLLKWTCPVRLVVHSHNIEGLRWRTLGKWWWSILWHYEKWVHRQADLSFFIQDNDKEYAILKFGLKPTKCLTVTYGFERDRIPSREDRDRSRREIGERHGIPADEPLLFFNGAFNFSPNLHALEHIIERINPLLIKGGMRYKILVCGKDIPDRITQRSYPNVHFAGFVPDIQPYFMGADLFLNPVLEGGGIKTKLVEALGNNLTAVSSRKGAEGIDPEWCNGKLLICEDGDWEGFTRLIREGLTVKGDVPAVYFDRFFWGHITKRASEAIDSLP